METDLWPWQEQHMSHGAAAGCRRREVEEDEEDEEGEEEESAPPEFDACVEMVPAVVGLCLLVRARPCVYVGTDWRRRWRVAAAPARRSETEIRGGDFGWAEKGRGLGGVSERSEEHHCSSREATLPRSRSMSDDDSTQAGATALSVIVFYSISCVSKSFSVFQFNHALQLLGGVVKKRSIEVVGSTPSRLLELYISNLSTGVRVSDCLSACVCGEWCR